VQLLEQPLGFSLLDCYRGLWKLEGQLPHDLLRSERHSRVCDISLSGPPLLPRGCTSIHPSHRGLTSLPSFGSLERPTLVDGAPVLGSSSPNSDVKVYFEATGAVVVSVDGVPP